MQSVCDMEASKPQGTTLPVRMESQKDIHFSTDSACMGAP
jgi:hypothetical protein